jgi:anaerobic selenocysteine-containing dehydrogenase
MLEDVWIKSACNLCFCACAIRVHRVDGVVVKIEGNPDCPTSQGRICARGMSGMMLLYDPNRVNVPLKRTNPEKGIGVDPGWVEISWDEALDAIAARLKKIKAEDPRQFLSTRSPNTHDISVTNRCFGKALGSPNTWHGGGGPNCGNGMHLLAGMIYSSWGRMFDFHYTNYYLNFGCSDGFGVGYGVTYSAERMADARERGMKVVVIDPAMGRAALKADEWIPIRPGTDAAVALAMVNLLLNEYNIFDAEFLKYKTNGPYLIKEDGHYLRDGRSGKPMVWDSDGNRAKTYDDPTLSELALEGSYTVAGTPVTAAFSLIREHVKKYTPEMVAATADVPAETIRRLAREFGEAARIGSTIVVDGKVLPYRPVAVGYFRGAEGHRHSALTCMSFELLQQVVGAVNVPGGEISLNARSLGVPETGSYAYCPVESVDGILSPGRWHHPIIPWPPLEPKKPESIQLTELIPTVVATSSVVPIAMLDPGKYGLPFKIKFNLVTGSNYVQTVANPRMMEEAFRDVFTVSFSLYLDESTEFADIILPDGSYLERLDMLVDGLPSNTPVDGWAFHVRQPVVAPVGQRRSTHEVLLELAERVGILGEMYTELNHALELKGPYVLDPAKKYTWDEIVDRRYKSLAGPDKGLAWFKENGLLRWPKSVEEIYWRCFVTGRTEIYFEHFITLREKIEAIKKQHNIPGFYTDDYQPVPDWKPCPSHEEKRPEYDLYGFYLTTPVQTSTSTQNNPWLEEACDLDPYARQVLINTATAKKKGLRDGDPVTIVSAATGNGVEGRLKLTEGIHPEAIAYYRGRGHWSRNMPVASRGETGICPTWLLPLDWEHLDTVAFNLDLCAKVKITRKSGAAAK